MNDTITDALKGAALAMQSGQLKVAKALFEGAVQASGGCSVEIDGDAQAVAPEGELEALLGLAEVQWQLDEKPEALSSYDRALQLVRR